MDLPLPADFSFCRAATCPKRSTCLRYQDAVASSTQSFISPDLKDGACGYYIADVRPEDAVFARLNVRHVKDKSRII